MAKFSWAPALLSLCLGIVSFVLTNPVIGNMMDQDMMGQGDMMSGQSTMMERMIGQCLSKECSDMMDNCPDNMTCMIMQGMRGTCQPNETCVMMQPLTGVCTANKTCVIMQPMTGTCPDNMTCMIMQPMMGACEANRTCMMLESVDACPANATCYNIEIQKPAAVGNVAGDDRA